MLNLRDDITAHMTATKTQDKHSYNFIEVFVCMCRMLSNDTKMRANGQTNERAREREEAQKCEIFCAEK